MRPLEASIIHTHGLGSKKKRLKLFFLWPRHLFLSSHLSKRTQVFFSSIEKKSSDKIPELNAFSWKVFGSVRRQTSIHTFRKTIIIIIAVNWVRFFSKKIRVISQNFFFILLMSTVIWKNFSLWSKSKFYA